MQWNASSLDCRTTISVGRHRGRAASHAVTRSPSSPRSPAIVAEMTFTPLKRHVAAVLGHTGGNVSQSARILGIDRVTLYNKMRKYGIRRDGEEEPERAAEQTVK